MQIWKCLFKASKKRIQLKIYIYLINVYKYLKIIFFKIYVYNKYTGYEKRIYIFISKIIITERILSNVCRYIKDIKKPVSFCD